MADSTPWISATRARRCVQSRLVPDTFDTVRSTRLNNIRTMKSALTTSKVMPLSAFGFVKTRPSWPKKRKTPVLDVGEVEDSQFDATYCPITPRKKVKREALSSPAEPLRSDNLPIDSSDGAPTSPLTVDAQNITTPRVSRFIEHDTSESISSPEIPSSLAYERYHYEAWLKETPARKRVQHYSQAELIASPPSSSPYHADGSDCAIDRVSPLKSQWLRTPAGFRNQIHTPPPTQPGHNTSRTAPHNFIHSTPTSSQGTSSDCMMRIPLRELDPSCVLRSQSRKVFPRSGAPASMSSKSNSFSIREDSPTEWFDALESLTPQLARQDSSVIHDDEEIDADEHHKFVSGPSLSRANTVQDSQFDESLQPLSTMSEETSCNKTEGRSMADTALPSDQSQAHSWQVNNSLLNTLLPPGYNSAEYGEETQNHDYSSELCPLPPSSTRPGNSPITKRKFSSDDLISELKTKKHKHDTKYSDGIMPQSSWEQDNSLMYTLLQPPPFSLPSTAEQREDEGE